MTDDDPGNTATAPARRDGRWFELVVGASAILISAVSLFVAISANRTQERMLAASVWPSLLFGTSNVNPEGEYTIAFELLNRGTGPARIRWAELLYDGVAIEDQEDLLRRCCESDANTFHAEDVVTSGLQNRVLGVDEWVNFLLLPRQGTSEQLWQTLNRERRKIELRACYCSVLDDCWLFDSAAEDPQPVRTCPAAPAVLWQG